MKPERWRCVCTYPDGSACAGDTTFVERDPDGACRCSCHAEYQDDLEHWQPLSVTPSFSAGELEAEADWLERMEAAERLVEWPA